MSGWGSFPVRSQRLTVSDETPRICCRSLRSTSDVSFTGVGVSISGSIKNPPRGRVDSNLWPFWPGLPKSDLALAGLSKLLQEPLAELLCIQVRGANLRILRVVHPVPHARAEHLSAGDLALQLIDFASHAGAASMHLGFTVFFTAIFHISFLPKESKRKTVHPFEEQLPECFAASFCGLG